MLKRALLLVPVLVVVVLIATVLAFNAGLFHDFVQGEVRAAVGPDSKVHLGSMRLMYRWPPLVRLGPSVIDAPAANLQWQNLEAELLKVRAPYSLSLNFDQLHVIVKPLSASAPPVSTPPSGAGQSVKPAPLSIKLNVVDGEIKSEYGSLSKLNLKFEQKLLMKSTAAIQLEGSLRVKLFPLDLPLRLSADKLTFSEQSVKAADLKVLLAGLSANVQGASLLGEGRHRWLIEVMAKDLSQLPEPPMVDFPAKKWRGEIQLKAEISKDSTFPSWTALGSFLAKGVGADINYKQNKTTVTGPFQLEADGKFSYEKERATVPSLKASLDLSAASVNFDELLSKAAGLPLRVSLAAGGDAQKLNIQELLFDLWNFSGKAGGNVDLSAPLNSDIQFSLKPVSLTGAERIFPPLRASPVQGELSLSGAFSGPLTDPMKARIRVDTFALKKFAGVLNFEREGLAKIRGPVVADIQGKFEFDNGQVKSAEGRGSADLSAAALVAGPLRKEEKAAFRIRFGVRGVQQSLLIDEMDLTSFIGNLVLKGKVELGQQPTLDVNLEARPLSLSEMRIAMPEFRDKIPKGTLNSRLQMRGKLETAKPWQDWPMLVTGNVDVNIPEYKMLPPPTVMPAATGLAGPAPTASFLPDGELTRKARLNLKVQIAQFVKEPLIAKGIAVEGLLSGGKFLSTVNVAQVFGGSVGLKNLSVPMLLLKPKIQGNVSWLNLVIEDAIAFTKPEFKGFAVGKTAGVADFVTLLPDQPDFMAQLKVRGDAVAQPVVLNSVKVGEMINAQMAKVPQLKLKPMKVDPLRGQVKMKFDLNDGVVEIPSFVGIDADNSEIHAKGKVALSSMEGDFAGTFFWSDPPVKGCALEGNADPQGRLIVPVSIKGNLMRPGFSLLSDVIGKLASKTLECESKKLVEKVKADGKQKLEKELKNTLKNLLGK